MRLKSLYVKDFRSITDTVHKTEVEVEEVGAGARSAKSGARK